VLEHVGERDRIVAAAVGVERVDVDLMDRRTGAPRRARRGTGIELDAFNRPAIPLRERHEAAGVGTDIEKSTARRPMASLECAKDTVKNKVLRPAFELVLDPAMIPRLVVHAIEEPRQRRQCLGLTMAAPGAAYQQHLLARLARDALDVHRDRVVERRVAAGLARPDAFEEPLVLVWLKPRDAHLLVEIHERHVVGL